MLAAHGLAMYTRLVGARVRGQLQYRVSFVLQVVGSFVTTFVELLAIFILFNTFGELAGWKVGEVAFLYGLVSVAWGLTEMLGSGFDQAPTLIRMGEFDRILTRPVSAFVQVAASDFQLRRIGRVSQGLLALGLAHNWVGIEWSFPKALVFLLALLSSSVVFFTVLLIGAAICFWTVEQTEVQNIFTYGGSELASYPMHIYNRWLLGVFLGLVPLALTVYYPALYVLDKADPLGLSYWLRFTAPLAAAVFLCLGLLVWRLGLRHYQSTGS